MKWSKVSVCYHPTTIVFVDDQKTFLDDVKLGLDDHFACKFFSQPEEAISYLKQDYQFDSFLDRCVLIENEALDQGTQSLDIRLIRNEAYNKKRFSQISTLISDYSMPGKNGLECCQETPDYLIKILLTGQADNDLAVAAFNKGIINKFMQKLTPNVIELLNQAIYAAQIQYFIGLSEQLYHILPKSTAQCLTDPIFADFFYNLIKEKQIVEYYLTDERGSFLLLDRQGRPSWLAIANNEQMESYYEIACGHENAPASILDDLKTKSKLPYFYTDEDLKTSARAWLRYLHPAKKLSAKETYYYAYIQDDTTYKIEQADILPYARFLDC